MTKQTRLATSVIYRRRASRLARQLRAIWHDTSALWREFRWPIIGFMFVSIVGGFVYGELYYAARGAYIALIDRPYIMLQLMILETPEDVPPEPQLVIFWYLLPPLFVFLIGRGAADFVRLFFNRNERRNAWREAVASTFRNHIIVFGVGHVGLRVIRELVEMGFDVVALDNDPDPGVEQALVDLGVPLIVEDGRLNSTLAKAGLKYADALVACTGNDHINLEVVMKARDMNPDVRIVVRSWDDRFARQIQNFMHVQSVLSSSDLSAPAFAGAAVGIEITQTIQINGTDFSMVRLAVEPGSFLDGATIGRLQTENDMDIVLHRCNDHDIEVQPSRDVVVRAGDTLVIFAQHDRILSVVNRNRKGRLRA